MEKTLTLHWIICSRLVPDMNKKWLLKGMFICATCVTVILIIHGAVTVNKELAVDNNVTQEIPHMTIQPVEKPMEKSVYIVDNSIEDEVVSEPSYTDEQLEILAIIIYQEAGGDKCSDDTRLKVGSVFLNRVNSPLFPDTFEEVATAERQYGTLYWTGIKWPERAAHEQESHAVERAYTLAKQLLIEGSILPDNVIWQAEFPQGDGTYCDQDGIYFCYSEVNE